MGRKTKDVVIGVDGGRDAGRLYRLTEMSALQAERWATKVFLALNRSGIDIPEDVALRGIAGLAIFSASILSNVRVEEAGPLLDEMMTCVAFVPNQSQPQTVRCPPWADDIEEVRTIVKLRMEVLELHTGFSVTAFLQQQVERMKAAAQQSGTSSTTQTSTESLETSFSEGSPPSTS